MTIVQLTFQRVVNLGGYETERLEATASVAEGEDPAAALAELRRFVEGQLGLSQAGGRATEAVPA